MGRYLDIAKAGAGQPAAGTSPSSETTTPTPPPACQGSAAHSAPPLALAFGGKEPRAKEVKVAYAGVVTRLSRLYRSDMNSAWDAIAARSEHVRAIEIAEIVAEREACAYLDGRSSCPSIFQAALNSWEKAWATALVDLGQATDACQGCARNDLTLLITTTTGRYCRRCLRDEARHG